MKLLLSKLPQTWILDIDGVIFVHNSHLSEGDELVPGFFDFYNKIRPVDKIILISAREEKYRKLTEKSLNKHKVKYDVLIMGVAKGERILINDQKPKGLKTSIALNTKRDIFPNLNINYSDEL